MPTESNALSFSASWKNKVTEILRRASYILSSRIGPRFSLRSMSGAARKVNQHQIGERRMKLSGSKNIIMGGALALALALAAVIGFAQQQQGTPGPGGQERHGRGEGREGFGGGFGGGFFENLNLTDAQKEQMKQIAERYHQTFKAKRGEGVRGERRGFDPLSGAAFD